MEEAVMSVGAVWGTLNEIADDPEAKLSISGLRYERINALRLQVLSNYNLFIQGSVSEERYNDIVANIAAFHSYVTGENLLNSIHSAHEYVETNRLRIGAYITRLDDDLTQLTSSLSDISSIPYDYYIAHCGCGGGASGHSSDLKKRDLDLKKQDLNLINSPIVLAVISASNFYESISVAGTGTIDVADLMSDLVDIMRSIYIDFDYLTIGTIFPTQSDYDDLVNKLNSFKTVVTDYDLEAHKNSFHPDGYLDLKKHYDALVKSLGQLSESSVNDFGAINDFETAGNSNFGAAGNSKVNIKNKRRRR